MNSNFSKELRDLSQKILICADEFDKVINEMEYRTQHLEAEQFQANEKINKQDKVLKGLKDLLAEYD